MPGKESEFTPWVAPSKTTGTSNFRRWFLVTFLYLSTVFFRVGGVLIPTRSFGDFLLKSEQDKPAWKQVLSVVPQIQTFKLDSCWEFVVVGSDGVWDAMSNSEMLSFVRTRLHLHIGQRGKLVLSDLCEQILDMCCAKTVGHYGKNSCDNMTIIIIWFDHGDKSETGSSVVSGSSASR